MTSSTSLSQWTLLKYLKVRDNCTILWICYNNLKCRTPLRKSVTSRNALIFAKFTHSENLTSFWKDSKPMRTQNVQTQTHSIHSFWRYRMVESERRELLLINGCIIIIFFNYHFGAGQNEISRKFFPWLRHVFACLWFLLPSVIICAHFSLFKNFCWGEKSAFKSVLFQFSLQKKRLGTEYGIPFFLQSATMTYLRPKQIFHWCVPFYPNWLYLS